jgi:hypothetical protein
MPEARSPATQKAYGIAGTAGKSGRLPADEVHSVVRAPHDQPGTVEAMGAPQEGWLYAATTDPTFCLK